MNSYAEKLLDKIMRFVEDCGQSAFPGWTYAEIRNCVVCAGAKTRMQIFVDEGKVSGLCIWDFRESDHNIHVVALVGNRNHINFMRQRWAKEYPTYSITFHRGNKLVQFNGTQKD